MTHTYQPTPSIHLITAKEAAAIYLSLSGVAAIRFAARYEEARGSEPAFDEYLDAVAAAVEAREDNAEAEREQFTGADPLDAFRLDAPY